MHRREVLLDPLHGLVLAIAVRRPGHEEGQDPWWRSGGAFASLSVSGCRVLPWLVLPELSFSR